LPQIRKDIPSLPDAKIGLGLAFRFLDDHPPGAEGVIQKKGRPFRLPGQFLGQAGRISRNYEIKIFPEGSSQKKIPHRPADKIYFFLSLLRKLIYNLDYI
jgi:hypothetical protein